MLGCRPGDKSGWEPRQTNQTRPSLLPKSMCILCQRCSKCIDFTLVNIHSADLRMLCVIQVKHISEHACHRLDVAEILCTSFSPILVSIIPPDQCHLLTFLKTGTMMSNVENVTRIYKHISSKILDDCWFMYTPKNSVTQATVSFLLRLRPCIISKASKSSSSPH